MAVELIVNGGFEEHLPLGALGWGIFTTDGAVIGWSSPDYGIEVQEVAGPSGNEAGDAVVELATDRNSTVEQTVTASQGGDYVFSFSYAMGGTDPATNGIAVTLTVNGVAQTLSVPQPVVPGYLDFSQTIALGAGDVVKVSFAGTGIDDDRGVHIDDVSLALAETPPLPSENLILNGEFEDHVDLGAAGWAILTVPGALPGWWSPDHGIEVQEVAGPSGNEAGDAVVELATDRNTTVAQTVLISETGFYDFSFSYALGGLDAATNGIAVSVATAGAGTEVLDVIQPTAPGWLTHDDQFFFRAGDEVTFSFTGTGIDDARGTHIDSVSLFAAPVAPGNSSPVAQDDTAQTAAGQSVTISVLANDNDPDLDTLLIAAFEQPANGRVSQVGNALVYLPDSGFTGTDTFRYWVADEGLAHSSAQVEVSVSAAAPPASNLVVNGEFEDHPDLGAAGWGVLSAIPGWTSPTYGIEVQEITGPSGNAAGDAVVELATDRNTTISQSIAVPVSGTYELAFDYALGGTDIATNGITVTLDTQSGPLVFTPALPSTPGYVPFSTEVALVAGEPVTLSFTGTGTDDARGTHIDGVSLTRMDTGAGSSASFFDPFDTLDPARWGVSDGWSNGFWQSSSWDADQVAIRDGELVITIAADPDQPGRYLTGEVFSRDFYGYGTYEARVQISDAPGTVSALFTYVGPGLVPGEQQDEIDFEFLGRDPFSVQSNYFVDGVSSGGHYIPLGVDASQTPVDIAFDWSPDALRWYVNGTLAHEVLAGPTTPLPDAPGLIFMDLWSVAGGDLESWAGAVDPAQLPAEMRIDYFAYTAPGDPAQFADSILG